MPDPTIPELVARLRELRVRASFRSFGRPTYEAEHAEEQLRDELRSALPTLLDALERQPSGDCGGVAVSRVRAAIESAQARLDKRRASGSRITGSDVEAAIGAFRTLLDVAHSPDGGKVVSAEGMTEAGFAAALDRAYCDLFITAAERDAALEKFRLERRIAHLESLTTWRPISEPPSAEVHAWCGGWFALRDYRGLTWANRVALSHWPTASHIRRWLPIPPSDERRG